MRQGCLGLSRPVLNEQINFPLCLAPMVGLTHVALRLLVREYLPADAKTIWPTEMLNSRRLPNEDLSKTPETLRCASESELVPQILGNEEKPIAESVKRLVYEWGASAIDINMGCPVQKALKHNYGVALMGDADYAARVVEMTVKHSAVPVSVKLRAASQPGAVGEADVASLYHFTNRLREAGASWITLHPRTAEQKRRGSADWSQIKSLRENICLPVIGNGDIQTDDDVIAIIEQTGCDMAMAGRALAARPWLLWQLGERLGFAPPAGREGQPAPRGPMQEGAEYGRALLRLIEYSAHYFSEDLAMRKVRFYVRTTSVWLDFGQTLIGVCAKAKNIRELENGVRDLFTLPIQMCSHTELRQ